MKSFLAIAFVCLAQLAWAQSPVVDHPFARHDSPQGLDLSLGRLEWGRTTLGYSQAWAGGQSFSQGFLLKDLRARLSGNLNFDARFGLGFTPNSGLSAETGQAEFVIPFAALAWQPSEHFELRLEYSRLGRAYFPMAGYFPSADWTSPSRRVAPERLDEEPSEP